MPALGHLIYTEILGNEQVMMASSSSSSTGTFYKAIDISGNCINTMDLRNPFMSIQLIWKCAYQMEQEVQILLVAQLKFPNNSGK